MPDGSGWVLRRPQGHGLLAGSGGMQQIPRKISARGGGFKSEPLKSAQVNINGSEAEYNNYCCKGTTAAKLGSRRTSKYPNH